MPLRKVSSPIVFVACLVSGVACNSGSGIHVRLDGALDQASGSGGSTGTGGDIGGTGGGAPGAGGLVTGGTVGPGGVRGNGGVTSTGGATSAGGTHSSGGTTSSGGGSGSGGSKGSGGSGTDGTSVIDASADARTVRSGDPCRSVNDCLAQSSMFLQCLAPGEFGGCGICLRPDKQCATDVDCAPDGGATTAKQVCIPAPASQCYCGGEPMCQPGCRTAADCPSGNGCNSQHACQKTCTVGDGTCAVNSICNSAGFCEVKTCTTDTDCSGACVKGKCYSTPGTCQPMAA